MSNWHSSIQHVVWLSCKLENGKSVMFPAHMIQCMEELDSGTQVTLVSGSKFHVMDSISELWEAISNPEPSEKPVENVRVIGSENPENKE